jgi:hypothetical protein
LPLLAVGVLAAAAARADDNPWAPGANWMYLRAGYFLKPSKVSDWKVLGIEPLGFLPWTLFKSWSVGGFVEYDVMGRFGTASDIEMPAAIELTRHMRWKSAAKPYLTFGVGPFFRKLYHTGSDFSRVRTSGFIASGFDAPVGSHQMLGFDVRMARVMSENKPVNPVFGAGQQEASHWSMKLAYAIAY